MSEPVAWRVKGYGDSWFLYGLGQEKQVRRDRDEGLPVEPLVPSSRLRELEEALRVIADGTEDKVPPFRSMGAMEMQIIAQQALSMGEE